MRDVTRSVRGGAVCLFCIAAVLFSTDAPGQVDDWVSLSTDRGQRERVSKVMAEPVSVMEVTARSSIPGMFLKSDTMADGETYTPVLVPGGGDLEEGKPDLPVFGNWILVPNGTTLHLEVSPGQPRVFTDIKIPPLQPDLPEIKGAKPGPFVKDLVTYATNADYPGVFARTDPIEVQRGQPTTILWLYPFQYNPIEKTLSVYSDLTVTVHFTGTVKPVPSRLKSEALERTMRRIAANADLVLAAESELSESGDGRSAQTTEATNRTGCDYLIISHPDYETAADTLAAWKHKSGFRTKVVTTTTAGSTCAAIRTYLNTAYTTWDPVPQYLLLLGDSDKVPTCHTYTHPSTDDDQGETAADFLYATIGTIDLTPELAVGRIPVDSLTQASNFVSRILDYEKNSPLLGSFYTNVTHAAAFQDGADSEAPDGKANRRFAKTSEDVRNYLNGQGYSTTRIYRTYNPHNSSTVNPSNWSTNTNYIFENDTSGAAIPTALQKPTFPWNGSTSDMTNAVNAGTFFITHRDHGSRNGWGEPDFDEGDVNSLTNGSMRPVVWSVNCQTGWFDNETDAGECGTGNSDESFAEAWIRHSTGGAIGVIASTRISWSGYNDRLVWGWMDAIWPNFIGSNSGVYGTAGNHIYKMGDVLNYGKAYLRTKKSCSVSSTSKCFTSLQQFTWFGDPTMEMWTSQPGTLAVTKPDFDSAHKYLDVLVKDSATPVEGARVTLYKDGSGWYSGLTDSSGKIRFNFTGTVTATFDLTVTAKANPTLDINFADEANLETIYYKVDASGSWQQLAGWIGVTTYTSDWSISGTVWNNLSQGTHYLYFKVVDDAGNETITANNTAAFDFKKDTVKPGKVTNLSSDSHTVDEYDNDTTIDVSWTAAADATSGLHGYSYQWSGVATTVPDTTEDIDSSVTGATSNALTDGTWYFHIRARDSTVTIGGVDSPHWGDVEHDGPFYIDTVAPQAPTFNTALNQWYNAAPTLDVDFQDNKDLESAAWKKKDAPSWITIVSGHDNNQYTTNWPISTAGWNGLDEATTNKIYFKLVDDAGNEYQTPNDSAAFTANKDLTGPGVTYNTVENQLYGATAPTLDIDFSDMRGTGNGRLEKIEYKINSGGIWVVLATAVGAANYTSNWSVDAVKWGGAGDGTNYLYFRVTDKAGNVMQTANNTEAFALKKDTLPPAAVASITNTGIIVEGDTVYFDGTGSSDAAGIAKYEWDFDNSNGIQIDATGSTPTHQYGASGSYTATLTVYDPADNAANATVNVGIKARPDASIDSITPSPAIAGQKVTFQGSGSDSDPGDTIVAYTWRSNRDGQLSTSSTFNTTQLSPSDTFPNVIYFKVKDSDGYWSDEVQTDLWIYVPKKWDMFKDDDVRNSFQETYPNTAHGILPYVKNQFHLADSALAGSAATANLDGKWINGLEIAFASTAGTLYVVDSGGKLLWSKNIGASSSTPAIEDIDGDGNLDIAVGSVNGVYAYDRNGTALTGFPYVPALNQGFDSSPVIADMDNNMGNGREIAIGNNNGSVYGIQSNGTQLFSFASPTGQPFTSSPAVYDLEPTSPGLETVIGGRDGYLYIIDITGTQVAVWPPGPPALGAIDTTPAIADLVPPELGWPGPEIVFGADDGYEYCLNYDSSTTTLALAWQYPVPPNPGLAGPIDSSPAIGKVGESGEKHVAFGCDDGNVYVLRADVGTLDSMFFIGGGVQINSTPAIANIDTVNFVGGPRGDLPEVIVGATDGNLYALNFAMGPQNLPWSPLTVSGGWPLDASPAVSDINHDPDLEILIGSANSRLYRVRASSGFNNNPNAILRPDNLGLTGDELLLDASESEDPDEETTGDYIARYEWVINSEVGNPYETSDPIATLEWPELVARGVTGEGDYPLELTVYDTYDEPSPPEMANLVIRDFVPPPIADPDGPYEILVGQGVTLDGSSSFAEEPGNEIVAYLWEINDDGQYDDADGAIVTLAWNQLESLGLGTPGVYTVWLQVFDWLGQDGTAPTTLTIVENQVPEVQAGGPYQVEEGDDLLLTATGSDPDGPPDEITSWEWDIDGDGVFGEYSGDSVLVEWSYLETACPGRGGDGPNAIRVRAFDTREGHGTSEPTHIYIYGTQPVAVAKAEGSTLPLTVTIGEEVSFNHAESYHQSPQRVIVLYEWDLDGDAVYDWSTPNEGEEPVHAYPAAGVYDATLRVTDNNEPPGTDLDSVEVTVENHPPVADAGGPYEAELSDPVTLDGSGSYDPDGTIVGYEWNLDGDGVYGDRMGLAVTMNWPDLVEFGLTAVGVYPIELRVVDSEGAEDVESTTLTISHEQAVVPDPTCAATYSDPASLALTVYDDEGETLKGQLGLPKTFHLELDDGSWQPLDEDVLASPDDADDTLDFSFEIQSGLVDVVPGAHLLRLRFDGDSDYGPSTQSGLLDLQKEEVLLSPPDAVLMWGESTPCQITAHDDDGDPCQITAHDDDGEFLLHQSSDPKSVRLEAYDGGEWIVIAESELNSGDDSQDLLDFMVDIGPTGVDLPAGAYELVARFDGDTYYNSGSSSGGLGVEERPVQLLDDLDLPAEDWEWSVVYTDPITIHVRLTDFVGQTLANQFTSPKVVYLEALDGADWVLVDTDSLESGDDSDDTLAFDCEIREGLGDVPPGAQSLRVRFDGDGRYAAETRYGTITVEQEQTQITDPWQDWNWVVLDADESTILVKLSDDDGQCLMHLEDDPKIVHAEYWDGGGWTEFATGQVEELVGIHDLECDDVLLQFSWTQGEGNFEIRLRYDGGVHYSGSTELGVLTVGSGACCMAMPEHGVCAETEATICDRLVAQCCGDLNTNLFNDSCEAILLTMLGDEIYWSDHPEALGYDIIKGDLDQLLATEGDFSIAIEECVANNHDEAWVSYIGEPDSGHTWFFLVRMVGETANMTYAPMDTCDLGTRDAEIEIAPFTCQ